MTYQLRLKLTFLNTIFWTSAFILKSINLRRLLWFKIVTYLPKMLGLKTSKFDPLFGASGPYKFNIVHSSQSLKNLHTTQIIRNHDRRKLGSRL